MDGAFAPDDPLCGAHVVQWPLRHAARTLCGGPCDARHIRCAATPATHDARVARRAQPSTARVAWCAACCAARNALATHAARHAAPATHGAQAARCSAAPRHRNAQHTAALRYRPPLPRPQSKPSRSPSGNEECRKPMNQAASRVSAPRPSPLFDAHRPLAHSSPPAYRSSASPRAATPRAAGTRAASACRCAGTAALRRACTPG